MGNNLNVALAVQSLALVVLYIISRRTKESFFKLVARFVGHVLGSIISHSLILMLFFWADNAFFNDYFFPAMPEPKPPTPGLPDMSGLSIVPLLLLVVFYFVVIQLVALLLMWFSSQPHTVIGAHPSRYLLVQTTVVCGFSWALHSFLKFVQ